MKLFPMSEDIQELCLEVMKNECSGLAAIGLNFKFVGTTKANTVVRLIKGNPLLEYIADESQIITITIYEKAFDKLTDEYKKLILASAFASVEYDAEKDKVSISDGGISLNESIYFKYREPSVLAIFNGKAAIKQIQEEEKEEKVRAAEERAQKKKLKNT
jgi:hypothetical protein